MLLSQSYLHTSVKEEIFTFTLEKFLTENIEIRYFVIRASLRNSLRMFIQAYYRSSNAFGKGSLVNHSVSISENKIVCPLPLLHRPDNEKQLGNFHRLSQPFCASNYR